jgi:hypothetical protein
MVVEGVAARVAPEDLGPLGDPVDLRVKLAELRVQVGPIRGGQRAVGRLHRQLEATLEGFADVHQTAIRNLHEADSLVDAADRAVLGFQVGLQTLADGEPCGVVPGTVDAQTGRELGLDAGQAVLGHAQVALGVEGDGVGEDTLQGIHGLEP